MEDNTVGLIIATIIGLLYFVGIGSLILSFIYDPEELPFLEPEKPKKNSVVSSYRSFIPEEEEASSVILDKDEDEEPNDFTFSL